MKVVGTNLEIYMYIPSITNLNTFMLWDFILWDISIIVNIISMHG